MNRMQEFSGLMAFVRICVLAFSLIPHFSYSQKPEIPKSEIIASTNAYDSDLLKPEFHKGRREALRALMPEGSAAIIFANPVRNRSNDVDFEYSPDPDLRYLSGFTEPNSVLVIFKENRLIDGVLSNEILFIPEKNIKAEVWTGRRMGKDAAMRELGITAVRLNSDFTNVNINYGDFSNLYHSKNHKDVRGDKSEKTDLLTLFNHFEDKTENLKNKDGGGLSRMMAVLREIKQPEELVLMRKAIDITCDALKEHIRSMKPGKKEYQAEAIIEYVFKEKGAEHPGFPSIVGSGENSCILHYISNRRETGPNDLIVSDVGAEYHGYTADVTRTIPVNGTFSKEQKLIYNIVLKAQAEGIKQCLKDKPFSAAGAAATEVIKKELLELGIIKKEEEYRKYFFHGTSHYLGLDVHDAGTYGPLKQGNVITVEPGIYIAEGSNCDKKWWNIGVRIEDDILITDGAPEILSACVPRTIEEIEALMKEKSLFIQPKN